MEEENLSQSGWACTRWPMEKHWTSRPSHPAKGPGCPEGWLYEALGSYSVRPKRSPTCQQWKAATSPEPVSWPRQRQEVEEGRKAGREEGVEQRKRHKKVGGRVD